MMKNKFFKAFMATVLGVTSVSGLAACGGDKTGGVINDPTVLNVKIHSAGYGTTYIQKFKEEFEEIYKEENYQINILTPDPKIANQLIYQEIYSGGGVDVYIATGEAEPAANYIGTSVFADITESVVNQVPIGKNKVEGENTIGSYIENNESDRYFLYDGKYYGIPIATSVGGLGVNVKVLEEEFGITELPRTTDEMFAIVDTIMKKTANDISNGGDYMSVTHPFAYALAGNQYWMGLANMWFRQYSGDEAYDQFWSFEDANGNARTSDCYEVFNDEGLNVTMNLMFQFYDYNTCMPNVATDNYLKAQHHVVQGNAIFCPTGDWMFNEEKNLYAKYLQDIDFIKPPVVSALGTKLFGAGTSYNYSDEKCEELLLAIIDGVDANKTVEEIKASLPAEFSSIKDADILTVCDARGVYRDSSGTCAYISEKSTKKDLAVLFLRYIASEDGALAFSVEANTTSPYSVGKLDGTKYKWLNSVNEITTNIYASSIVTKATGYRLKLGVTDMFYQKNALANLLYNEGKSIYNPQTLRVVSGMSRDSYQTWSDKYMSDIYANAKTCVETKTWK